jgi:fermentation-respiration switch protein FrsA (DUF1100 family)
MNENVKKALRNTGLALAGTVTVGAVATCTATNFLMKLAMDREAPKTKHLSQAKKQLHGGEDHATDLRQLAAQQQALKAAAPETVELDSSDGTRLVGHWHHAPEAKRVIIAMHGWRSSWTRDFAAAAPFLHENGCSVLYAEQRGHQNSGGDYIGFGMLERYDCLAWANWAAARSPGLPIYLAGVSMGAATVLMTTGLELPDAVHGIIADCGFTSPHAIWKHVVEQNLHLSYGVIGSMASDLCRRKIQLRADDCTTVEALRVGKTPVLFIHGAADTFVPISMTYENYEACAAPKRLLVVPGADHAASYATDPDSYRRALRGFWDDFDA